MADPKVRINPELKKEMAEEVENNPEYSSQKAFVNKAVRKLLDNESDKLTEQQIEEVKKLIEKFESTH